MVPDATAYEIVTACKALVADMRDPVDADSAARVCIQAVCSQLRHYNWLGVYWLHGDDLHLGAFEGAATEHTRIPVGRGVCGTAVAENANQVIDDVRNIENYLACSVSTRAEIVVLIRDAAGTILGQLDADGHDVGVFDRTDEALLGDIAALLAPLGKPAKLV